MLSIQLAMLLLTHQQFVSHIILALFHLAVTVTLQVQVLTTTELARLFLCRMTFLTLFRLDTRIYIENNDFGEGAYWGATFGGYAEQDGNGHGTAATSPAIGNRPIALDASRRVKEILGEPPQGPMPTLSKSFLTNIKQILEISSLAFNGSLPQCRNRTGRV